MSFYRRGAMGLVALMFWWVLPVVTAAHESRPLYIEINQLEGASYSVQWRTPVTVPYFNLPAVVLPEDCEVLAGAGGTPQGEADYNGQRLYRCGEPLPGREIAIVFPQFNPSLSSMLKYHAVSGEQHMKLLGPDELRWQVPDAETATGVAWTYTVLGVDHIWAGVDHLLFVLCLLWIAGSLKRIFVTITGFTLAHSVTLGLSALGWVRLPIPPVEAAIALSIVFLAAEIAKGRRNNLTWRYPIAVSTSFGLLHGFGFAAALGETGLPQTQLLTGLLFFNLGVEIGQVIFAAGVIALALLLRALTRHITLPSTAGNWGRGALSYSIGGIAAFWLLERSLSFAGV